ncbi:hypothetical protein BDP27DRAFT_700446 [Rhodocollybia butyracea]|uniref:Uncharacterized protein n=1 Tax=Rhodocollybia butyracea TaxID=206335 RepID=A0A9P5Q290_9AGAR|nr:hypothetical protein BDP27DRAFT_700446 [Rhodocollybia butyracea]
MTTEASALAAEASTLVAEASTLVAEASSLAIEASSLSEAATSATSSPAGHATPSTVTLSFAAQREASSTATETLTISTFTSTSFSTSLFITDGHTTTSVTSVVTTGVTIIPDVATDGTASDATSKTNTGGIIGGVIVAAVAVLVAIVLVFYRLHRRKKASVERKMSEFGSDYPPRAEPFLIASQPRPLSNTGTRPSRPFSTTPSTNASSNSAVVGSAHQSASIVAATAVENTDFDDEKADLTILGQRTSSHSVPGNSALHRSSTLFSADSDPPPSYRATAIDFTLVPRDS